jgi:hypothetical protein
MILSDSELREIKEKCEKAMKEAEQDIKDEIRALKAKERLK